MLLCIPRNQNSNQEFMLSQEFLTAKVLLRLTRVLTDNKHILFLLDKGYTLKIKINLSYVRGWVYPQSKVDSSYPMRKPKIHENEFIYTIIMHLFQKHAHTHIRTIYRQIDLLYGYGCMREASAAIREENKITWKFFEFLKVLEITTTEPHFTRIQEIFPKKKEYTLNMAYDGDDVAGDGGKNKFL